MVNRTITRRGFRQLGATLLAVVLLPWMADNVQGGVVANFTDGNGSSQVDQYVGAPGLGWLNPWNTGLVGTVGGTPSVVNGTPLGGGGNHLNANLTANTLSGPGGYASLALRRTYGAYGGVRLNEPQVIEFDYRVDALPTGWGGGSNDRLEIFDRSALGTNLDGDTSWFATAYGQVAEGLSGKWLFGDFQGDSPTWDLGTKIVNSGIKVNANSTYHFAITVHPAASTLNPTYDVALTDGTSTFRKTGLGLRSDTGPFGNLHWAMRCDTVGDTGSFSLDSISISPVRAIVANFTDGLGDQKVDQHAGIPGLGWKTAWSEGVQGTLGKTQQVISTNPLHGGDNYLSTSLSNTTNGPSGWTSYAVCRQYGDYEVAGIRLDTPHTIQFDYRVDALPTGWGSSNNDRIEIFDTSNPGWSWLSIYSPWFATVYGKTDVLGYEALSGHWLFGDFQGSSTAWDWATTIVDSGITLTEGSVYSFRIELHPGGSNPTYDVTLTDGTNIFRRMGLGLRNDAGPFGNLFWAMRFNQVGDTGAFSLDSVAISAVPEPASAALAVSALLAATVPWFRRRRR